MTYFPDQMTAGKMHDHMDTYSVAFWHTNAEGYRTKTTITLYIEQDTSEANVLKTLRTRYTDPEIISVKYQ